MSIKFLNPEVFAEFRLIFREAFDSAKQKNNRSKEEWEKSFGTADEDGPRQPVNPDKGLIR